MGFEGGSEGRQELGATARGTIDRGTSGNVGETQGPSEATNQHAQLRRDASGFGIGGEIQGEAQRSPSEIGFELCPEFGLQKRKGLSREGSRKGIQLQIHSRDPLLGVENEGLTRPRPRLP